jgi:very-short-patch-repair endonuclease
MRLLTIPLLNQSAAQHAVVAKDSLTAAGLSDRQIHRLVQQGVIERVLHGAYRFTGAPVDELARLVAASTRSSGLIVAGPSAGRLLGYRRMPPAEKVHVLAPPAAHPTVEPWLVAYRTKAIEPVDVIMRPDGIRVTSHRRTLLDLTRFLTDVNLRSVIDQGIAEGHVTVDDLYAVAEPVNTRGRPWVRRFIGAVNRVPNGGAPESHLESRVAAALVDRNIPITTQHWLDVPNFGRIRIDIAVASIRWAIEIDGHPDHFTEAGATRDRERDLACDAIDWKVSRVTGATLRSDFDGTIDGLVDAYRRRTAEVNAMRVTHLPGPHLSSQPERRRMR